MQNDVVSTSMRRHHVASTLTRRDFYIMCPLGCFSAIFTRGTACVTSCLLLGRMKAFSKRDYYLQNEFPPQEANAFFSEMTLLENGDKMKSCLPLMCTNLPFNQRNRKPDSLVFIKMGL